MSRRHRAEKRVPQPDPIYGSEEISRFINKIMIGGKKTTARRIVYGAIKKFAAKVQATDELEAFEKALENAKPSLEVKSRRIGGSTYQVPIEVPPARRSAIAMRWVIGFARSKAGRSMEDGLAIELADCYNNQGTTIKKKDDTHRMAESNKAFAQFK
jgi:small subunit ribosomal protein S7